MMPHQTLLYLRKRSVDASDDFFSESEDDWFESDVRDDNETVSEECQNFTMPTLTPDQMANLMPLAEKYKKDGFSSDVGKLAACQSFFSILKSLDNLKLAYFFSKPYQPEVLPRAVLLAG